MTPVASDGSRPFIQGTTIRAPPMVITFPHTFARGAPSGPLTSRRIREAGRRVKTTSSPPGDTPFWTAYPASWFPAQRL